MKKGTILYIGGFELPDKNAAAHRVLSNGKILRELGYKVVFIGVDKTLVEGNTICDTKKIYHDFECWSYSYPRNEKEWIKYLIDIENIKKVKSLYNDIRAIIIYNYQSVTMYRLKRYCTKNNIKLIADCTEWYSAKGGNIFYKVVKGFDSFLRMRILHKQLDGLIVISEYLKKYYEKNTNTVKIPPLVDLKEEKWDLNHITSKHKTIIKFVYAGSSSKDKDKDKRLLLKTFYELKNNDNFVFNIVGITKNQYLSNYPEDKVLLDSLGDKIIFWGRVSHIKSLEIVKASDFSIFFRENTRLVNAGFPTKFVESISSGVPVITNKTSDLEYYLIDGVNGYFIEDDAVGIRKILKRILTADKDSIKRNFKTDLFYYKNFIDTLDKFMKSL